MLTPQNIRQYTAKPAEWMPAHLLEHGFKYTTSFTRAEKRVLRKRKYQRPSEWAPKNRKIVKGNLAGNFLSLDVTPHLRGLMDAAVLAFIRRVHICAAPQTAKTTGIDTIIAWCTIFAPGPAVSFYPDETTAKRSMKERLQPMVRTSPSLSRLRSGHRDDFTATGMELTTMSWEVGWVGSVAQTADRSLRYVDMQEVNKPSYGGGGQSVKKSKAGSDKQETGVVELLLKRPRAYGDTSKVFISSSPTTEKGNITQIIEHETEAVFIQWVTCPHCHNEILMSFSRETFYWPKGEDGHSHDRKKILSQKLARYVCQECAAMWDDNDRNRAIRRDVWRLRMVDERGEITDEKGEEMFRYLTQHRPSSIGFIIPSWTSYFVSLSEVAHDFLRSTDKSISEDERFKAKKDFKNGHEALPWKPDVAERLQEPLKKLKNDLPDSIVPGGGVVACLVAGVDTQDNGFWYWIHAVGYGRSPKRWLLRASFVHTLADLEEVLWGYEYKDAEGNIYPVQSALQDSAGHRTSEVYDFCSNTHGPILPTTGQRTMASPYSSSPVEFYPGPEKKKFPGSLTRINVNTSFYKDKLDGVFKVKKDDPGCFAFNAETTDDTFNQLCSETIGEDGVWEQIGNRPNHLWDCAVLALAAEDVRGVRYWSKPDEFDDDEEDSIIVEEISAQMG